MARRTARTLTTRASREVSTKTAPAPTESTSVAPPERELTPGEHTFVQAWAAKALAEHRTVNAPPAFCTHPVTGGVMLDPTEPLTLQSAKLCAVTGTTQAAAQNRLLGDLLGVVGKDAPAGVLDGMLGQMLAIAPRDGLEGMLAAQMVATHHAATKKLYQVTTGGSLDMQTYRYNQAAKLMRLFALQMDTLARYRGKGAHTPPGVTVHEVHVHEGGQAIVGTVANRPAAATSGDAAGP